MPEFSPHHPIVKLCLQGMTLQAEGRPEQAGVHFQQAWEAAESDHEKFLTTYFLARHQDTPADQLKWQEVALELALKIDDDSVRSALPMIYQEMAALYEAMKEPEKARLSREKAAACPVAPSDQGPFYHGTRADLQPGEFLVPGGRSNYDHRVTMNHIYFTALAGGAGLAASMAKGDGPERVYIVEPTGEFENDPNVTNKKFPGNPTWSFRSLAPLKVRGELKDWARQSPEELKKWKDKLARNKGEIIN